MRTPLPSARDIHNRHVQLEAAAAVGSGSNAGGEAALARLATEMLDAGAAEWAWQLLSGKVGQTELAEDPSTLALAFAWASALYDTHRWKELVDYAERLEAQHVATGEPLARIFVRAAWAALLSGDTSKAGHFHHIATTNPGQQQSLALAADSAFFKAYSVAQRDGQAFEALRLLDTAIALFRHLGETRFLMRSLMLRSVLSLRIGAIHNSQEGAYEVLECAGVAANPTEASHALIVLSILHYRQGNLAESLACIDSASEIVSRFPGLLRPSQLSLLRARVALMLHEVEGASTHLARAEKELATHPNANFETLLCEYRAIVALANERPVEAAEWLAAATARLDQQGDVSYYRAEVQSWESEALLALNRPDEALAKADAALALLESTSEVLDLGRVLRVRAFALAAVGRTDEARASLVRSEATLRRLGDLYELGLTLLARCEHLADTPDAAVAAAAEALRLFEQMGVTHLAGRAGELLAQAQIRLRAQQPHPAADALQANQLHANPLHADPLQADPSQPDGLASGALPAAALVDGIVAASPAMRSLLKQAKTFAPHPGAILLTGETGVGKEVVARFIHQHSRRRQREFVPVNCAAVPETLFEREFFGHAKGAFTGAESDRPGLVEYADGGTLFLDEIGELPLAMQAKLLRLVQEGTYRRVGEVQERRVSLRIVAATNRNLQQHVRRGTFREDLLYRLGTIELEIPPLRTRPEDVVPLIHHFLERESERSHSELWMTTEAWTLLKRYAWPGNVRELDSALAYAAPQAGRDGCIHVEHLPRAVRGTTDQPAASPLDLAQHLMTEERRLILKALERTKRSRAEAARALGISRNTLYDKMKRLGIDEKEAAGE